MTDGLPTDEQLRRIERGVHRRIDLRRRVAHRIAGTTAAVALLGGGIALLVPLAGGVGSSGGSTAAGAGSAASAAAPQQVACHVSSARDSASVRRDAPAGSDDRALIEACGAAAVDFQSSSGRMSTASPEADPQSATGGAGNAPARSASPSRGTAVLCEAPDGVLHVFPADRRPSTLCARNGMRAR